MKKKSLWSRAGDFLMGKGFYMVLLLCVTAIGASGYYLYGLAEEEMAGREQRMVSAPAQVETVLEEPEEQWEETSEETLPDLTQQEETRSAMEETETLLPTLPEEPTKPAEEPAEEEPAQEELGVDREETGADEQLRVAETAGERKEETSALFQAPVPGQTVAAFSNQELTYNEALEDWRTHNGVDLSAELGQEVAAAMAGEVLEIREDVFLGTTITINHGDGLMSLYGNLNHDVAVAQGDRVEAGQVIGAVGQTAAGEKHEGHWLHFAMTQDGESVDPADYLSRAEAP